LSVIGWLINTGWFQKSTFQRGFLLVKPGGRRSSVQIVPTPLLSRIICFAVFDVSFIFLMFSVDDTWTADRDPDIERVVWILLTGRLEREGSLEVGVSFSAFSFKRCKYRIYV